MTTQTTAQHATHAAGASNGPLKGDPRKPATPQPRVGGWHWVEWACEFGGTAFQLFLGFSVVALLEAPGAAGRVAIGSAGLRLVLIGIAFGLLAAAVAVSPVGKRSGAHLNPAVTLGFFAQKHTSVSDLVGYVVAQILGALLAAFGLHVAWGHWARGIHDARTAPSGSVPAWEAVAIEAGLTMGLLLTVFLMVSSARTARWTPIVVTGVLSGLIWAGAPYTGASMNPARTLGPDIVSGGYPALWVYFVGPPLGALLAALAFTYGARERRTLTAKLFHDSRYPTTQRSHLPAKPHQG